MGIFWKSGKSKEIGETPASTRSVVIVLEPSDEGQIAENPLKISTPLVNLLQQKSKIQTHDFTTQIHPRLKVNLREKIEKSYQWAHLAVSLLGVS